MIRRSLARCGLAAMVFCSFGVPVWSQSQDYLPLTRQEIGARFPLKRIGTLSPTVATLATAAGPGGSKFTVADGLLSLDGQDSHNKPWSVDLFEILGCMGGVMVYEGDLDRDGVRDVILMMPTCGNGLAPSVHLVTVTFDPGGRPIPFEAEGYFDSDENGIDALVDLDRDRKADLIFMNFDDGYWITNIYSVDKGRWHREDGRFAGRTFPLYTRFTNRPNKLAVIPAVNRHPGSPDLSNTKPQISGLLSEWHWPGPERDLQLTVVESNGQATACAPQYWYDSARLIMDEPEGRRVIHLSESARAKVEPVLTAIVSMKLAVSVFGRRSSDRCSPELLWAAPENAN